MSFSRFLLFLSLMHGSLESLDGTERFWTEDVSTGIHYQINSESALTWHQARKSCQQQNAELLSIAAIHEQAYIGELTKNFSLAFWIGLSTLNFNSGWQWAGDSPFRYLKWAPGSCFLLPGKICGVMNPRKNAKWENQACNQRLGYLCGKKKASVQHLISYPKELRANECTDSWWPYAGHCYNIQREPRIWKDALTSCKKQDGDLASVRNTAEYGFLVSRLGYNSTEELWLGLNDLKTHFYFEWSDGTPVTFTTWQRGHPTYTSGLEDCIVMKGQDGYWATDVCDKQHGYICKKKPSSQSSEKETIEDPGCQNQVFLVSLTRLRSDKYFWISLSSAEERGSFRWTSGETPLFTHWNTAMLGKEQGCVAMGTGIAAGLWDVVSCEKTANYLCTQQAAGVLPPAPMVQVPAAACAEGWDGAAQTDTCFKFFVREGNQKKSLFEAEEFCRETGGNLVTINSREDQILLWQLALDKGLHTQAFWISLFLLNPDEGFAWIGGSPVIYENWDEDEPNNYEELEHCVMFNKSPKMCWNDLRCEHLLNWICETKRKYQATHDGWILYEDKQYYFSKERVHIEARRICQKFANLVVIENESERQFLWKYDVVNETWIRLDDINRESTYIWSDGRIFRYYKWVRGFPFRDKNIQVDKRFITIQTDCIVMTKESIYEARYWQGADCQHNKSYICQMDSKPELFHSTTAPGSDFIHYDNSSYLIIPSKMNWEEARKACKEKSSELASIFEYYSNTFLLLRAVQYGEPLWMRLNSNVSHGYYRWTDKRKMIFSKWYYGEPKQKPSCVYLELNGAWKTPCKEKHFPVCKKSEDALPSDPPRGIGTCPESDNICWIPFQSHCNNFNANQTSWAQSVTQCTQSGGMLTSVDDLTESNFLAEHADLYTRKTSGFWIGIYRNVNGQLLWQDNSALDFLSWGEGQPLEDQLDFCVELSAFSGYWSILPCSSQRGFICKKPKTILKAAANVEDAKKDKEHGHMNMWILLTLVLIILSGMGFTIYFLFKIKTQSETERETRRYSTALEYSCALTGRDDENDSTKKEKK